MHRYSCFLEGDPPLRLTGCWSPRFEFHAWSNVVCVGEGSYIEEAIDSLALAG